ncbi:hypothetical protein CROQUDRAFT_131267 [Cronartium quercuum f. sp. fusiforme G11]|uniref:Yeast cell wall synthesis Kre9/Knh1-like N-terminal domain-containing protein n=1 Tax=Cronartium quercuum f. sp. fusiforme G11 TaxID=708437 RepID=A0A9P6NSM5_9BASI|nr:hypothetical protein CROQUDRAFT_131267 [Cronartium quercuum f. sp. fusiforme G11]
MIFSLSIFILAAAQLANASLSPTFPVSGSMCQVGQPCQIKWIDTPAAPTTASMGETTIDLVCGDPKNLQIAQRLGGVTNPSVATALTFTPDTNLNSTGQYAIRFLSKSNSTPIFSTFFTITGGTRLTRLVPYAAGGTGKTIPATTVDSANATTKMVASSTNSTASSSHNTTTASNSTSPAAAGASDKSSSPARFTYSSGLLVLAVPVIALLF